MPTYSERNNRTLLTGASDPDNDPIVISRINGSAGNVGAPVPLAGGAGGAVTVTPQGVVTLDDATLTQPPVGSTAIAGTFTYVLSDGALESASYTATVEVTGAAGLPAGFGIGLWSLSDAGTGGALTLSIGSLPDDGGAPLVDIEVQIDAGSWTSLGSGTTGSYPLTGLADNQAVSVALRALNSVGAGPTSDVKSATPTAPAGGTLTAANETELQAAIATAAAQPGTDWQIICQDFTISNTVFLSAIAMSGSLIDQNQAVIDAAQTEADIYANYDKQAMPQIFGGSITLRSATRHGTVVTGNIAIDSAGPIKIEGFAFHRTVSGVTDNSGALNKTRHSIDINHDQSGGREPLVWIHDCLLGSYAVAPAASESWVTTIEADDADTVIISDCFFDGTYNCGVFRHVKKVLRLRNRIGQHRINDVWSNIQANANTNLTGWTEKKMQCVGEIVLPNVLLPFWGTSGHSDYHQVGASSDDRDYDYFMYNNYAVNEQCLFTSSTFPADQISVRGWILGNFFCSENSHAITAGTVAAGNRLVIADNTVAKWTFGPQHVSGYGGISQEAQIRVHDLGGQTPGTLEIRGNVLGRLVGPGSELATDDSQVPAPPALWGGTGTPVAAASNAYVDAVNATAPTAYAAAFSGSFAASSDGLDARAVWSWTSHDAALFKADVDAIFAPKPGGPADGRGHTQTASQPAATVPTAFSSAEWTLTDRGTGGALDLDILQLPAPGGSVITGIEYRIDAGAWIALAQAVPQSTTLSGLVDGTSVSIELRAVNAVGPSAPSTAKQATPTSSATVPAGFAAQDWSLFDTATGGRLTVSISGLPFDGGSGITDIQFDINGSGSWTSLGSTSATDTDLTGLTNGQSYDIRLRAVNTVGAGPAAAPKTAVPSVSSSAALPLLLDAVAEVNSTAGQSLIRTNDLSAGGNANQMIIVFVGLEDTDNTLSDVLDVTWNGMALSEVSNVAVNNYNRGVMYALPIGSTAGSAPVEVRLVDPTYTKGQVVTAAVFRDLAQVTPTLLSEQSSAGFLFPYTTQESVSAGGLVFAGWQGSSAVTYSALTGTVAAQGATQDASVSAALQYQMTPGAGVVKLTIDANGSGDRNTYGAVFCPMI